ncbi:MAG: hypothetical protein A3F84_07650 [Candidatus Handelsmanbacteria bacterium RIFCSPLOWO2_12_FULL_64_10]|uniref:Cyclophilin TM1367-like domain-containing protein n=1 Tax=Handelsmanbacteria sp. (strain RIFCSPLOWO2_12_FULL_64_10) TaxID=1817868 RepID=A0A1F6D2R6_HANXR|nr:MAG: hypothetical protein A3F84_07650 [Candidatus Handelsmanbacteria bacterium RIFCSPLOWO2_12_FULL_64_10]
MPKTIRITVGDAVLSAELNDSKTAQKVWEALPLTCDFNTWGDEVYFSIPVEAGPENPQAVVQKGDLGYWPPGHAFCIFYGRTPASSGDEIRPASPVNPLGRVLDDVMILKKVAGKADQIQIEKA